MASGKSVQQSTSVNEFARGRAVLFAAFVGIGVSLTSIVYCAIGIWVRPWQEEFGWTRAEIGAQQSISVLVLMLLATFAGRLIDLYGLRSVTTISLLGYGLLLLGFTQMTGDLWMLYTLSAACAVLGVASTALAFTRAVNAFFVKYRGLALGISLTSAGFMAYLMPRFVTPFVVENGWHAGYVVMFFMVMAALPNVYLLVRDTPDDDGLDDATISQFHTGLDLRAALRTVLFWKIAGIFFLVAVAAAIALGFAVRAEVDLIGYYTARYFGLAHYGAIYGIQYSIFILGAGVSPILIGHIWDKTGNYDFGLMLAAALRLPVMAISLTLPKFTHE